MSALTFGIDAGLGLLIGFVLGLLGGGGSILTVPALVYVVGQSPQAAVTASLIIVGANSAIGALIHRAQGTLNWRVALVFGGAGMVAAYLAAGYSKLFAPTTLMILFALLMLVVGLVMILRRTPQGGAHEGRGLLATLSSGLIVGALTGLLGVGGGFLIVPALVMLVGLPMRQAVGTSLIVIAMNSLAGFMGHLDGLSIDLLVVGIFAAAGIIGTYAGARLAQRLKPELLRRGFALFIIGLACLLLIDNVGKVLTGV
jgi:hypothetical protein